MKCYMIPPIANRFVAGETIPEALEYVRTVNAEGLGAIVNRLGEHHTDGALVEEDTEAYLDLVDDIGRESLEASISVKPTQLGLDLGVAHFQEHLSRIVDAARKVDVFVWVDMEGSGTTEDTITAFETAAATYPHGVGVCLQSNLRRTADDITRLTDVPGKIRLVKGAYREPAELAYQSRARVDEAVRADLEALFRTRDEGIALGSHDPTLIAFAEQLHAVHGTPVEFQLLMGVRTPAQERLAAEHAVSQYIPYGTRWLSYFSRRAFERTDNAAFALRAILGR